MEKEHIIKFSDEQWKLLYQLVSEKYQHRFNEYTSWVNDRDAILRAGLDKKRYDEAKKRLLDAATEFYELKDHMKRKVLTYKF